MFGPRISPCAIPPERINGKPFLRYFTVNTKMQMGTVRATCVPRITQKLALANIIIFGNSDRRKVAI
jgi:hypothetical protein